MNRVTRFSQRLLGALRVAKDSSTTTLSTMSSSRRFKKEIKPMDSASEAILALKPVTFHYKNDKPATPPYVISP